jgi:hypothetical protein
MGAALTGAAMGAENNAADVIRKCRRVSMSMSLKKTDPECRKKSVPAKVKLSCEALQSGDGSWGA